jgi:hypothetical protein
MYRCLSGPWQSDIAKDDEYTTLRIRQDSCATLKAFAKWNITKYLPGSRRTQRQCLLHRLGTARTSAGNRSADRGRQRRSRGDDMSVILRRVIGPLAISAVALALRAPRAGGVKEQSSPRL